jgi:hypothetical protein
VLVLTWVCSYCVRKRAELEQTLPGLLKPVGAAWAWPACCCWHRAGLRRRHGAVRHRLRGAVRRRRALRYVLMVSGGRGVRAAGADLGVPLKRLTGFLHPWDDPFNGGFQLTQSLIAIGRGGWFGVGLGSSVQKLFYLPEAHTDFVFAVLAEELGLVGVIGVIALFLALVWRAFQISRMAAQAGLRFSRTWRWPSGVAGPAGHGEHRREHGRAAHQGTDSAAAELRTQQLDREPGVAGRAAAHLSRGEVHLALRRHAHAGRRPMMDGPVLIMAGGTGGHMFSGPGGGAGAARSAACRWCGWACPAAWSRGWCRPTAFRSNGCGSRASAARALARGPWRRFASCKGVLQAAEGAAPRAAARGARRRRLCERPGRHRGLAAAHSAVDSRAECHRRV